MTSLEKTEERDHVRIVSTEELAGYAELILAYARGGAGQWAWTIANAVASDPAVQSLLASRSAIGDREKYLAIIRMSRLHA